VGWRGKVHQQRGLEGAMWGYVAGPFWEGGEGKAQKEKKKKIESLSTLYKVREDRLATRKIKKFKDCIGGFVRLRGGGR